jgi:hypothetical protein
MVNTQMCNLPIQIHEEEANIRRVLEKIDVPKEKVDVICLKALVKIEPI